MLSSVASVVKLKSVTVVVLATSVSLDGQGTYQMSRTTNLRLPKAGHNSDLADKFAKGMSSDGNPHG